MAGSRHVLCLVLSVLIIRTTSKDVLEGCTATGGGARQTICNLEPGINYELTGTFLNSTATFLRVGPWGSDATPAYIDLEDGLDVTNTQLKFLNGVVLRGALGSLMPGTQAQLNLPRLSDAAGITLENVALFADCQRVRTYQSHYCNLAPDYWRRQGVEVLTNELRIGSYTAPGVRGVNITVTCSTGWPATNLANSDPNSGAVPCSIAQVSTADKLFELMDVISKDTSDKTSRDRTAWLLINNHIALASSARLPAYEALYKAQTAVQGQVSAAMTFNRDVRILGLGARWQLDWGGRASTGLLGAQSTSATITFSNLTFLNMPSAVLYPPHGDFPWSLSSMFLWSVLVVRVPTDGVTPPTRDRLFILNCTLVVPDDELAYWTIPQLNNGTGSTGNDSNPDAGLAPAAFVTNADPSLRTSFLNPSFRTRVIQQAPVAALSSNGLGNGTIPGRLVSGGIVLLIELLQSVDPGWSIADCEVLGQSDLAGQLLLPPLLISTGLMSLGGAPTGPAVHLRDWQVMQGNVTSLSQLFPSLDNQLPHVRIDKSAKVDPLAMLSPPVTRYLLDGYMLFGNPLSPSSAVLSFGGVSGSPSGARFTTSLYTPFEPVQNIKPPARLGPKPPGRPLGRAVDVSVSTRKLLQAKDVPLVDASEAAATGVISVAAGTTASLRFLTLTNLGPFARQSGISQPGGPVLAFPFDSTIAGDPSMVLGPYTSLLWAFNLRRTRLHRYFGELKLQEVTMVLPPWELQVYMWLLRQPTAAPPASLGLSVAARSLLQPALESMLPGAVLINPTFNRTGPTPAITFRSFLWFGLTGTNVTLTMPPITADTDLGFESEQPTVRPNVTPPSSLSPPAPTPRACIGSGCDLNQGKPGNGTSTGGSNVKGYDPNEDGGGGGSDSLTLGLAVGLAVPCSIAVTAAIAWYLVQRSRKIKYSVDGLSSKPSDNSRPANGADGLQLGMGDKGGAGVASLGNNGSAYMTGGGAAMTGSSSGSQGANAADTHSMSVNSSILTQATRDDTVANFVTRKSMGSGDAAANGLSLTGAAGSSLTMSSQHTTGGEPPAAAGSGPAHPYSSSTGLSVGPGAGGGSLPADKSLGELKHVDTSKLMSKLFGSKDESIPPLDSKEWNDSFDQQEQQGGLTGARLEMWAAVEKMKRSHASGESQIEVHSILGRGAFGVAYKGTWRGLSVAVKRILFQLLASPKGEASRRKALREAAINATLSHPAIVATYSYDMVPLVSNSTAPLMQGGKGGGVHDWELSIIMEYCDQGSLAAAIRGKRFVHVPTGEMLWEQILWVAMQVASGLQYLHSHRIIHGDLKPDNVLLKSDPSCPPGFVAKVGDFGMSIKMAANQTHVSGVHHGTPLYVAPEILHAAQAAKAADVYSYGVLLWELGHGRTAWEQLLLVTQDRPVGRGMAYVPGLFTFEDAHTPLERCFADLTTRCLSNKPAQRPSFDAIQKELEELLKICPPSPAPPITADASETCTPTTSAIGTASDAAPHHAAAPSTGVGSSQQPAPSRSPFEAGAGMLAATVAADASAAEWAQEKGAQGEQLSEQLSHVRSSGVQESLMGAGNSSVVEPEHISGLFINLSYQATARLLQNLEASGRLPPMMAGSVVAARASGAGQGQTQGLAAGGEAAGSDARAGVQGDPRA